MAMLNNQRVIGIITSHSKKKKLQSGDPKWISTRVSFWGVKEFEQFEHVSKNLWVIQLWLGISSNLFTISIFTTHLKDDHSSRLVSTQLYICSPFRTTQPIWDFGGPKCAAPGSNGPQEPAPAILSHSTVPHFSSQTMQRVVHAPRENWKTGSLVYLLQLTHCILYDSCITLYPLVN